MRPIVRHSDSKPVLSQSSTPSLPLLPLSDAHFSLPQSPSRHSKESLSPPRLDVLISTCSRLKGALGGSVRCMLQHAAKEQKSLGLLHKSMSKRQGLWRQLPAYNTKRDGIKEALTDRCKVEREKEVQMLHEIIGVAGSTSNSFSQSPQRHFVTEDLLSGRMKELLSLNKRDFGARYNKETVRVSDRRPRKGKKIFKFKASNDNVMLKREIQKLQQDEIAAISRMIPPPLTMSVRDRSTRVFLDSSDFEALGPLNKFIVKERHKFESKAMPKPWLYRGLSLERS